MVSRLSVVSEQLTSEQSTSQQPVSHKNQPVPFIDLVEQYNAIADEVQAAIAPVFARQAFVLGEEVATFEREIAAYCGTEEAVGCASGTDALILSLLASDVGAGDEIITSPFTFLATGGAIVRTGAKPVFVDIDPVSYNLNIEQLEAAITPQTKAIMPVHLFGQCAEMTAISEIATQHHLAVIEDACQAIGAEYHGQRAGALGTFGCFSFYPTKNLSGAGDGGLITTNNPELAKRLRCLRAHGDTGGYQHRDVGMNSRLDALQAAVLRVKLRHLESWTTARQNNANQYHNLFQQQQCDDAIVLPKTLSNRRHVYNQYCIRIKNGLRDTVLADLRERNIGAAIYYPKPLHLQDCFQNLGYQPGDFPESEKASAEILALPIYPELPAEHQEIVVHGIAESLQKHRNPISTTPALKSAA